MVKLLRQVRNEYAIPYRSMAQQNSIFYWEFTNRRTTEKKREREWGGRGAAELKKKEAMGDPV